MPRWFWLFGILLLSAPLQASTKPKPLGQMTFIWQAKGVEKKGPKNAGEIISGSIGTLDLNGDSVKETIVIATKIGASQNGNTVTIFGSNGKTLGQFGFSSFGGCAYGRFSGEKTYQFVVWDFIWAKNEAHTASHHYLVDFHIWGKGRLTIVDSYRTVKKYPVSRSTAPLSEFLKAHQRTDKPSRLTRRPLDGRSLSLIKSKMPQARAFIAGNITGAYSVGDWALLTDKVKKGEWGIDVWQKKGKDWVYVAGDFYDPSSDDWAGQHHIPIGVWKALTKGL